ncbi:MAG: hypothetical protein JW934_21885 [Anaerolineae bacterium]|nr:hypothetical protein [Anaerolineae bacterium]
MPALNLRHKLYISATVFVFLCCTYLLTCRGLLSSIDELALFSTTESLTQRGSLDVPQVAFARYHNQVGRLEPLHPLLAVPLDWLALRIGWLGNVQTVLLLNIVITALTGGVLYLLLQTMAFPSVVAVAASLLFGLATISWPYTRTFFREPLTALLLLVAAWGLECWRRKHSLWFLVLTLGGLTLALLTKVTSALAWPVFALILLFEAGLSRPARLWRLTLLTAVVLIGGLIVLVVYAQRQPSEAAQSLLSFWCRFDLIETSRRLFGLTLGAGRGLFIFSPLLLLALPGLVLMWRRRRSQAALVAGLLGSFLVGYSRYSDWHAGLSWGSRFLLPIVPLLLVPVAEWLGWVGASRRWWLGLLTSLLAGTSGAIQLAASMGSTSWVTGLCAWDNLFDYAHSPAFLILRHWRLVHFDMLWWHGPVPVHLEQVYCNPWIALLPALGSIGAATLLWSALGGRRWANWRAWGGIAALLIGGVGVLLWQAPTATHGYAGANPVELRQVAEIVNRERVGPHTIVTVSNDFHLNVLLNYFKGSFTHRWLSPMQTGGFEDLLDASSRAHRLSLIVDRVHIPPESSGRDAELWLNARLHRYMVDWVGGGYEVYSYLYPPTEMPVQAVDYRWEPGMALRGFGLTPREVQPGEPVWLEFHLTAMHKIEDRYDIFVQFLSPEGVYVNGTDGPPQFGAAMTTWWQPGDTVIDRRAFFVPADAPAGEYRVIAGFYANDERLPVFDADGRELGPQIDLGVVQVQ